MRKTMLIVVLLALLLQPITGQAAKAYCTIGELRENLPERWAQTYETKWRTIDIDVQPVVPDVDKMPILQVMKDYWIPDIFPLGEGWSSLYFEISGGTSVESGNLNANMIKATKSTYIEPPYEFERNYGENSSLTLGGTLTFAKDTMQKLGDALDAWQYNRPRDLYIFAGIDKNTGQPLYDDIYAYILRQQLYGIPVLAHVVDGIEKPKEQEPRLAVPDVLIKTSTLDSRAVSATKLKIIDVDAESVPLCDFSLVQASLENEIKEGHIRKIFELELGYVLYTTPDPVKPPREETLVFYAVPTWQVQCFYMANGKKEMSDHSNPNVTPIAIAQMEYKTVFVNAQTGKVIDRLDNRLGCGNYQGFISWEDVGGKK